MTARVFDYTGGTNQVAGRCANSPGRGQSLVRGIDMANGTCSIDGCGKAAWCRGWCRSHYYRWKKHGDPMGGQWPREPLDLFVEKLDLSDPSGCWLWTASTNKGGYGKFADHRKMRLAHRWLYERVVGPIPPGMVIDHICRRTQCCNVDHLEVVTQAENVHRGSGYSGVLYERKQVRATSCRRGHAMDEDNTYVSPKGQRQCRACDQMRAKRRWATARAARLTGGST